MQDLSKGPKRPGGHAVALAATGQDPARRPRRCDLRNRQTKIVSHACCILCTMTSELRISDVAWVAAADSAELISEICARLDAGVRDDACSTATLAVAAAFDRWNPERGPWNAWAATVARNAVRDMARSERRHAHTELVGDVELDHDTGPSDADGIVERVNEMLDGLTRADAAILRARWGLGGPAASRTDVAARFGVTRRYVAGLERTGRELLTGAAPSSPTTADLVAVAA